MSIFEDLNPTKIMIAGDWHGNSFYAARAISRAADLGAEVVLHVGDFGFLFTPKFMARIQRVLQDRGIDLGFVAGNHDSYDYLDPYQQEYGCTAIALRPNIFYLPRCYRWEWSGVSFLALGGAHSVDRQWRTPGHDWWGRETIDVFEMEKAQDDGHSDVMICHDVPAGVDIPCIRDNPHGFPQEEIYAAQAHRAHLREVVDVVKPDRLFSGHYHCRLTVELNNTTVDILSDDSAPLAENTLVMDLADLYTAK